MIYGIIKNTDEKLHIDKYVEGDIYCPSCNSLLVPKRGDLNIHHFAHKSLENCDVWWENKSQWHIDYQNMFDKNQVEVMVKHDNEKHFADVKLTNTILELQYSSINVKDILQRNDFYTRNDNLIWLFKLDNSGINDLDIVKNLFNIDNIDNNIISQRNDLIYLNKKTILKSIYEYPNVEHLFELNGYIHKILKIRKHGTKNGYVLYTKKYNKKVFKELVEYIDSKPEYFTNKKVLIKKETPKVKEINDYSTYVDHKPKTTNSVKSFIPSFSVVKKFLITSAELNRRLKLSKKTFIYKREITIPRNIEVYMLNNDIDYNENRVQINFLIHCLSLHNDAENYNQQLTFYTQKLKLPVYR